MTSCLQNDGAFGSSGSTRTCSVAPDVSTYPLDAELLKKTLKDLESGIIVEVDPNNTRDRVIAPRFGRDEGLKKKKDKKPSLINKLKDVCNDFTIS